jgi:hypothetical protein
MSDPLNIVITQLGNANSEIERLKTVNAELKTEAENWKERCKRAEKEDTGRRDCISAIVGRSLKEATDIAKRADYRVRVVYEDGKYCPRSGCDNCDTGEISLSVVKGNVIGQWATDKWGKSVYVPPAQFTYGIHFF